MHYQTSLVEINRVERAWSYRMDGLSTRKEVPSVCTQLSIPVSRSNLLIKDSFLQKSSFFCKALCLMITESRITVCASHPSSITILNIREFKESRIPINKSHSRCVSNRFVAFKFFNYCLLLFQLNCCFNCNQIFHKYHLIGFNGSLVNVCLSSGSMFVFNESMGQLHYIRSSD